MLIWGQWVFVLNSWVSWCFCDTVAPDVQMRLCWKCWFEGNESLFLIPESPDVFCDTVAPDVQMRLCWKCWFEGNEYLFLIPQSPNVFCDTVASWCSNETLLEMLFWGQWDHLLFISETPDVFCDTVAPDVQMRLCWKCWFEGNEYLFLNSWVSWVLLWHCCTWCSNETLLEMLIWGQWVFVLNSWVSWVFCDTVAPDVQMRLCWKCWFEGNEYLFLIPESPDAFVTLLPLMFKWDFVGNVDLRAMSICS